MTTELVEDLAVSRRVLVVGRSRESLRKFADKQLQRCPYLIMDHTRLQLRHTLSNTVADLWDGHNDAHDLGGYVCQAIHFLPGTMSGRSFEDSPLITFDKHNYLISRLRIAGRHHLCSLVIRYVTEET